VSADRSAGCGKEIAGDCGRFERADSGGWGRGKNNQRRLMKHKGHEGNKALVTFVFFVFEIITDVTR
jgi:hypothetical protein